MAELVSRISRREEAPALQDVFVMEGILLAQGQEAEADNLLQDSIEAKERALGPEAPELIPDLERRAALLDRMGKRQEARLHWESAQKLRQRLPQPPASR